MFGLTHEIMINENAEAVWAFMSNLPVSLLCRPVHRGFEWAGSETTPREGTRFVLEQRLAGIPFRHEARVTRWEPPRRFGIAQWHSRHPRWGFSHTYGYSISPSEHSNGSILSYRLAGSFGNWPIEKISIPLVGSMMLNELQALKAAIESTDKTSVSQQANLSRLAEMPALGTG